MKKIFGIISALFFLFALTSCNKEEVKKVMTYAEFMQADSGEEVVIEGFVAAKQGWWNDKVTMYLTTEVSGEGYFIYNFSCSQEDNEKKYKEGAYIHIEATKTIYAEEHEIMGENITKSEVLLTTKFMSTTPLDITEKLTTAKSYQNAFITMTLKVKEFTTTEKDVTIAKSGAYGYKGATETDDLYFILTDGVNDIQCCVEVYLTSATTDVYQAVQQLSVGETIVVEGYLYWWNGANPHITTVKPAVLSYQKFMDTAVGDKVIIEGFVAAKQAWWKSTVQIYLTGKKAGEGYFLYDVKCSDTENNTIFAIGNYVRIYGEKMAYAGEQEVGDIYKFETIPTTDAKPNAIDLTNQLTSLINYQNSYFTMTLTVKEYTTTDTNVTIAASKAYGYKGAKPTDDLYFILTNGTTDIACCIEFYLTGPTTPVYAAVQGLAVGDVVTVTGYLYWWNGANPHIVSLTK